jgi:transcription-repair coupling factor (superfamily II helicase)
MQGWNIGCPCFFDQMSSLTDYTQGAKVFYDHLVDDAIRTRLELIHDYYQNRLAALPGDTSPPYNPIPPESGYLTLDDWSKIRETSHLVTPFSQEGVPDYQCRTGLSLPAGTPTHQAITTLKEILSNENRQVIIAAMSLGSRERLNAMFRDAKIDLIVSESWPSQQQALTVYPLDHGFSTPDLLLITESDLLGERIIRQVSRKKKTDKFLLESSQLSQGDLIVHPRPWGWSL